MYDLMTLPEVAEYVRRSEAQLRWMRHSGSGPLCAKIGGRIMYRRDDVDAWIKNAFDAEARKRVTV